MMGENRELDEGGFQEYRTFLCSRGAPLIESDGHVVPKILLAVP